MKLKDKRRMCVTKFAISRKTNTYMKTLLKHLLAGELAQVSTIKLKLAVDSMLKDVQAGGVKKM